jgi:metallo-beta-lactamase superfamily protein
MRRDLHRVQFLLGGLSHPHEHGRHQVKKNHRQHDSYLHSSALYSGATITAMHSPTRRNFLKSAGAVATPSLASAAATKLPEKKVYRRSRFAPAGHPEKITDNLYAFEDTCKVYIIRDGSHCVLIDFGSGKVLDHLPMLGISKVDYVLHTHHHRDQCQGDYKAVERGIPIAVPAHEKYLFADAENFWRNRRVFHLYYVRNDFNTITETFRSQSRWPTTPR